MRSLVKDLREYYRQSNIDVVKLAANRIEELEAQVLELDGDIADIHYQMSMADMDMP